MATPMVIECRVRGAYWHVKNHPMSGVTLVGWARTLWAHGRSIDAVAFAPRLMFLTCMALANTLAAIADGALRPRWGRTKVRDDPVFVLGHPRTGTTHLHNILAKDETRFGAATTFDVGFPSGFLSSGFVKPYLAKMMDSTRPMDNMALTMDTPQEDELATNQLSGCASPYAPLMFMRDEAKFRKYYELREDHDEYPIERAELEAWKSAFMTFMTKLQYKHGEHKRLVLKSPVHAARVEVLRKLFPRAQFVFISRHPYDVFRSAVNMADKYYWQCFLQRPTVADVQEFILKQGEILHDAYVRDSKSLPREALFETRFDDLDADPVGTLSKIYKHFGWDGFDETVAPVLKEYATSLADFKKNSFAELSDDAKEVINSRWARWFTDLNYEKR